MLHYKVEKWVQIEEGHERSYTFVVKDINELNQYWESKGGISTKATPISGLKYLVMKLLYNCYKKEYWKDQKNYF